VAAPARTVGLALVAAVTLDGVPENLALGVALAGSGSYALLASIVVSNFPEGFAGAARMREGGASSPRVLSVWGVTAVLLAAALVAGRVVAVGMPTASAAGVVVASLADSVMPEAYAEGGPLVAFATSAGFLAAYALTTLD
jgi:ZIP family zinc transporter